VRRFTGELVDRIRDDRRHHDHQTSGRHRLGDRIGSHRACSRREGTTLAKRRAYPTVESLTEVEQAALAGCPEGTLLEVIVEPTGPAWLPIAVFFIRRGPSCFG
jgi:hypothetical protein